ncbi:hypothetical protein WG66_013834 [Moniliophthora roreri]|uniref:Retrotransposon gag domain-containing protein n=1 Tax=Moniliophthora roreri TaxID=221103 RepID=A0A0W0F6J5_MONRR|nr:hypothetical protein WG66_013834 [Moniliophthora roreri]
MSIPGNFDGTNQQQSQFVPPGWVPSTEHPNPPAVSWTDLYSIYQTVSQLGATLGTMQQTQGATLQSLNAITAHLTQLWVPDEGPKGIPKFKKPNVFNGKALLVTQFLQDIRNAIQLSRCSLVSDHNKCLYFSTYFGSGAPKEWYNSIELNNKELLNDFGKFTENFKKHFRDSNIIATAQNKLDELYQTGSAAQYIARFNKWVVHLDLTDASKIHMLYRHLKASIKDAISFVPKSTRPTKFKDYCEFITGIDDCLHERELEKKKDRKPKDTRVDSPEPDPIPPSTSTTTPSLPTDSTLPLGTPMEIDAMKSKHHS